MKSIELDDGDLFYEEKGSGPALLLLHAGVADSRMWATQIDPFAEHHRTVWCDLRGYGKSTLPDHPFSYHEDISALVEALDLTPTWLVAASFGAQVAVDYYLTYPERVRGMVLVAPVVSGYHPSPDVQQFGEQEDLLLEAGKLEEATELNLRMWVDGPYRNRGEVDPAVRRLVGEMQLQAFSQPMPENVSLIRIDPLAIDRLEEIRVPLLIIAGALDVPSFRRFSHTIAEQVSGAQRVVIPDAAHMVNMEKPGEFNRTVLAFVSTLD